jgi:hypothetical protein
MPNDNTTGVIDYEFKGFHPKTTYPPGVRLFVVALPACPDCGGPLERYAGPNEHKRGTAFCHACGVRHRLNDHGQVVDASGRPLGVTGAMPLQAGGAIAGAPPQTDSWTRRCRDCDNWVAPRKRLCASCKIKARRKSWRESKEHQRNYGMSRRERERREGKRKP